jgi:multimeric flavodoxin WrbA
MADMNVVAVMGSPLKDGNVAKLTREVIRGAQDAGHQVKQYSIYDMHVSGCRGCRICKENGIDCILDDDLKPYWTDLHNAGALIVGAPNYCSTVCGPMITFMNRHYCILDLKSKSRLRPGIKLIGVFSQGNPEKDAYYSAYDWYLKDFENRDMVRHGMIVNTGKVPVDEKIESMTKAYKLGNSL